MFSSARFLSVVSKERKLIGLFTLVGLLAAAVFVFAQPLRSGATIRLLIIQRFTSGLDPYTAVKAAERIADNLAFVVHTEDFLGKTLVQDPTIDQQRFPADATKRRRFWQKTVRTSLTEGTGLLTVTALSTDKDEAKKIAQAIGEVLVQQGKEYVGGDLDVKLVDSPLVSPYPVSPNIPLGLGLGLLAGAAGGVLYVFWKEEAERQGPPPPT